MAMIFLLELLYDDDATRSSRIENDSILMTDQLSQCAENGLVSAFDNLVTCGVGEIGRSARDAAAAYEQDHPPHWDPSSELPVYINDWMAGAMKLWQERRMDS